MAQTAVAGRNIQDANHKVAHSFFLRALPARLSLLCRYGVPADFCGCRLVEVSCVKSGGDEDAAELAVHAGGGGWGLSAVPGSPVRCSVTSAGSWAVCQLQVIPAQRAYYAALVCDGAQTAPPLTLVFHGKFSVPIGKTRGD